MAVSSQEASVDAKSIPWWIRYSRWRQTSANEGIAAEKALYKALDIPLEVRDVKVGPGSQDFLHTTIVPGKAGQQPPIVWMPGYGAGTGFFFRNFEGFCRGMGFNLHAVDWLGTGLSGRPKYTATTRQEAEDFFINSLAKWREEAGLAGSKMVLVGHSLGGYLSAQYALRHPDHVHHLVLVCPAGVPEAPQDWEKRFLGEKWSLRGQLFKWSMALWEKGCTPGGLIRFLGPWGPGIVDKYVAGRFKHHGDGLDEREYRLFKEYFYHIAAAPGSGEYALRHLLAPGAWAYAPLANSLKDLKVPVTFIYGQHDWMKPEHGVQLCTQLRQERDPAAKHDLKVDIVRDAGHFVFMDQPELFNKALAQVCREYASPATAAASAADAARSVSTSPVVTTWGYDDSRRLSEELHVPADSEASTPQPAAGGRPT